MRKACWKQFMLLCCSALEEWEGSAVILPCVVLKVKVWCSGRGAALHLCLLDAMLISDGLRQLWWAVLIGSEWRCHLPC
jgi:hypothetical protein